MRDLSEVSKLTEEHILSAFSLYSYYDLHNINLMNSYTDFSVLIRGKFKSVVKNLTCNVIVENHYQGYKLTMYVTHRAFNNVFKKHPEIDIELVDRDLSEHSIILNGEYERYNPCIKYMYKGTERYLEISVTIPYIPENTTDGSELLLDAIKECTVLLDTLLYQAFIGNKYTEDGIDRLYVLYSNTICYNSIFMNEDDGVELSTQDPNNYFQEIPTTIREYYDIDFDALNINFILSKNMINMLKIRNKIKLFDNVYIEKINENEVILTTDIPYYIRINGKDTDNFAINKLKLGKLRCGKLVLDTKYKANHLNVIELTDYSIPMFKMLL